MSPELLEHGKGIDKYDPCSVRALFLQMPVIVRWQRGHYDFLSTIADFKISTRLGTAMA